MVNIFLKQILGRYRKGTTATGVPSRIYFLDLPLPAPNTRGQQDEMRMTRDASPREACTFINKDVTKYGVISAGVDFTMAGRYGLGTLSMHDATIIKRSKLY